ncbi:MAG: DNA topoisomerase [Candidatus Hermodarchaeota archaeon]
MSTLIIAEKNKAAKAIAEALGQVTTIKKQKKVSIYSIPSKKIYVLPLRGHLLEYRNTEEFKSWTKSVPRDIITNPKSIKKVPNNYSRPYIRALKEYGEQCNKIVIATDADIEGCNIGLFDALPFVKKINPNIAISQMWLSSLQSNEIKNKFNVLIPPKWSWAEYGEARAIIDAIIGFSATRELTNSLQSVLKKFNRFFISIGRVQTSLLYLIYLRDDRIENFISEPYYIIQAVLNTYPFLLKVDHVSNPFKKETDATTIYQKIKSEKTAIIVDLSKALSKLSPPTPLNTSKALVLLTKNLGISAKVALKTMSDLYLNKLISYPRTDSDVYKDNFNHIEYLRKFSKHSEYGKYSNDLLNKNLVKPTKGKKDAGDHPPITPIDCVEVNSTRFENNLQRKVYDILVRYYLALFGEEATESKTNLNLLIKDEPFRGKLVSLIHEGFLEIAPFLKKKYDSEIQIKEKELPIKSISLEKKETKPPPKYTDTTLLKLMENNNLGTKSTRPLIIQILVDRNLIFRDKRRYCCTELGKFLILNLKEIWLPFLKPSFTKFIEDELEEIKVQKKDMNHVIELVKKEFLALFDKFLTKKKDFLPKITQFEKKLEEKSINNKTEKRFPITSSYCPHCSTHPMQLITTKQKKRFLVCTNENCDKKYLSVPKRGRIYILDSICCICGFNVFKIVSRKNNKSFTYYLCPNCWNKGFNTQARSGFCSNCKDFKIVNETCVKKELIDQSK